MRLSFLTAKPSFGFHGSEGRITLDVFVYSAVEIAGCALAAGAGSIHFFQFFTRQFTRACAGQYSIRHTLFLSGSESQLQSAFCVQAIIHEIVNGAEGSVGNAERAIGACSAFDQLDFFRRQRASAFTIQNAVRHFVLLSRTVES
jgi:hypothetical protein